MRAAMRDVAGAAVLEYCTCGGGRDRLQHAQAHSKRTNALARAGVHWVPTRLPLAIDPRLACGGKMQMVC